MSNLRLCLNADFKITIVCEFLNFFMGRSSKQTKTAIYWLSWECPPEGAMLGHVPGFDMFLVSKFPVLT